MEEMDRYKNWLLINYASENTVKNYHSQTKQFLTYVKEDMPTEDNITTFFLHLREQKTSANTVNTFRNSINAYCKFKKIEIQLPNPVKPEKKPYEFISPQYLEEKIIPVINEIFRNPFKVRAIFYFMFYTGLRKSDIERTTRQDINLEERTVTLQQMKTKEPVTALFTDQTRKELQRYFNIEPEENNAFNTTAESIDKIFQKLKPHFTDVNLHPHLLRHSFATHCRSVGMKVEDIMILLGHKSIQSTMRYAHPKIQDIKKEYDKKVNQEE